MCGIAGVIEYQRGGAVSRDLVARMSRTLIHRGPDEGGEWTGDRVGISMRRLSIVDASGGHQPIGNEAGDCWIVCNGEIYNHRELRRELEDRGHRFRTGSDTEAILHLYEEEGPAAFRRLDGMFAFAIVDLRRGRHLPRLILVRDRLGKKPLFYADRAGALIFGSEIKAILAHGTVAKDIDREALHHYLSLLVVPEPLTIYQDIRKLPGGCQLTCDEQGVRIERYWDVDEIVGNHEVDPIAAPARIRELLFAAVRKRIDLEVPFGAFLSGGLDSGTVVAVMGQLLTRPVQTFAIGFEGPASYNELPAAAASARHFGTDHHELMARPDVVAIVHELVEFADEPLAISSSIPLLLLSREAGRSVKVVLTGDGGDEFFGGYPTYTFERWARLWRTLPRPVDRVIRGAAATLARPSLDTMRRSLRRVRRFIDNSRLSDGARRLGWSSGFSEAEKAALYAPGWLPAVADTPRFLDHHLARFASLTPEHRANMLDVLVWLPDEMLAKVDRMTMAASIEARSPLLDDALIDYVAGLSFAGRVPHRPGALGKPLMRQAVADLLPPHLLTGRKQGFNVPLDAWFRGSAATFIDSILSPERVKQRGVFDPRAVTELIASHRRGDVNACNRLFALVVFEAWAERYL